MQEGQASAGAGSFFPSSAQLLPAGSQGLLLRAEQSTGTTALQRRGFLPDVARMYCRIAMAAHYGLALTLAKVPFVQTGFSLWLKSGLVCSWGHPWSRGAGSEAVEAR